MVFSIEGFNWSFASSLDRFWNSLDHGDAADAATPIRPYKSDPHTGDPVLIRLICDLLMLRSALLFSTTSAPKKLHENCSRD